MVNPNVPASSPFERATNMKTATKSLYRWTDKAKRDALDKFARSAERLLVNGISVEELKNACDLAVAATVTHS